MDSLKSVGLEPKILPVGTKYTNAQNALNSSKGVLLVGGSDINPELYGQHPLPTTDFPDHERDAFELQLIRSALVIGLPILGICRGAQILAIAKGGELIQHIEGHSKFPPNYGDLENGSSLHQVQLEKNSNIGKAFTVNGLVTGSSWNSMHHQAIHPGKLPLDVKVTASSVTDRVVEAIELSDYDFGVGIQAHPEADFKNMGGIFREFALAVKRRG